MAPRQRLACRHASLGKAEMGSSECVVVVVVVVGGGTERGKGRRGALPRARARRRCRVCLLWHTQKHTTAAGKRGSAAHLCSMHHLKRKGKGETTAASKAGCCGSSRVACGQKPQNQEARIRPPSRTHAVCVKSGGHVLSLLLLFWAGWCVLNKQPSA